MEGSKVVDERGEPLVVYHGTKGNITQFEPSRGGEYGSGIYLTDNPNAAHGYADRAERGGEAPNIMPVYVSMKNPYIAKNRDEVRALGPTKLKAMGYDGIIAGKTGGYDRQYVVFSPEQIKSATGNSGTFDPANPDIRFSTRPQPTEPRPIKPIPPKGGEPKADDAPVEKRDINLAPETLKDRVLKYWVNSQRRIEQLMSAARSAGVKVTDAVDIATRGKLFSGKTNQAIEKARRDYHQKLVDTLRTEGVNTKDLDQYLLARHAKDANRVSRDREAGETAYGMTDADADKYLSTLDPAKAAKLEKAAAIVRDSLKESRRIMVESGLESKETIQAWEDIFGKDYVPVRSFEGDEFVKGMDDDLGRMDILGKESKSRTGGATPDSPAAFALHMLERTIVRAAKNQDRQALATLIKENPSDLWAVNKKHTERKLVDGKVKDVELSPLMTRDKELLFKIDGKEHRIFIDDPSVMAALKGNDQTTGKFLEYAGKATRVFSQLVTKFSPEFIVTNPIRDIQQVLLSAGVEHGGKVAKDIVKSVPGAMRALWRAGKKSGDPKWDTYAKEFFEDGVLPESYRVRSAEEMAVKLRKDVESGNTKRAADAAMAFIDRATRTTEGGTRLAVYRALRESGKTRQQAAKIAREMGVDFAQKGEAGPAMNALYAFFNANVQGTKRLAEVLNSKRGAALGASLVFAGAAMDRLNRAMAEDEDKDGVSDWDRIPEHAKERNLFIPGQLVGMKKPLMIPLPWGLNVVISAGRLLSAAQAGAIKPTDAGVAMASGMFGAFNPVGSEDAMEQVLSPTMLDPVVQLATNKTFRATPIVPDNYPGQHKPDSERFYRSASKGAVQIAKSLNKWTGGDSVTPGMIDVSPESIEHVYEFATGGLGRFLGQSVDAGAKIASGEMPSPREIPFARRLMYDAHPAEASMRYREMQNELDVLGDRKKAYEKSLRDRNTGAEQRREAQASLRELPRNMLHAKHRIDGINKRIIDLRAAAKRNDKTNVETQIKKLELEALRIFESSRRAPKTRSV
jgi:hypothetical protein